MKINLSFLLLVAIFLSGCAVVVPMNQPAVSASFNDAVHINNQNRSNELAVILTFSGGGMRAAALSYGVLKALRDTPIQVAGKKVRMLDEVDIISSVSGGSFTSAYYGLYGDRIFEDYEKRFLKRNIQTSLLKLWLLNPKNWGKIIDPYFNRADLVAEYYDKLVFEKKTFADFLPNSPEIVINATDLSLGRVMSFNQYFFNWICSDINSFSIGRAVAASSAVPILFSPITIKNYADQCSQPPPAYRRTGEPIVNQPTLHDYLQADKYRYLHLVDGGISDNLGIQSLLEVVRNQGNSLWNVLKRHKMEKTRKVLFIVVNAENYTFNEIAQSDVSPKYTEVGSIVSTILFRQRNMETLNDLKRHFPEWERQIMDGRCKELEPKNCDDVEFYLAEVNLEKLSQLEKDSLQQVPTTLELSKQKVDELAGYGQSLLKRSAVFNDFLNGLK